MASDMSGKEVPLNLGTIFEKGFQARILSYLLDGSFLEQQLRNRAIEK